MKKFWNVVLPEQDDQPVDLFLEGEIADETWYGDEVTPAQFKADLAKAAGRDVTVWINSPGGDVFAASVIYTALMEHKGHVTVKVEGLAASAASVIAMAGETVLMAPTAFMMIHNPWTIMMGNADELRHEAEVLDELAEGLVTAYQIKTNLSKNKIRQMLDDETWMSAQTAIDQGFADGLLTRAAATPASPQEGDPDEKPVDRAHSMYRRVAACTRMHKRIANVLPNTEPPQQPEPASQEARDAFMARMQAAAASNKTN